MTVHVMQSDSINLPFELISVSLLLTCNDHCNNEHLRIHYTELLGEL